MFRDALQGVRVLDFSQIAAGPACSMLLADMGAHVIKVEPPGGDLGRTLGPGWVGADSALFHAFNRNKQGICLDLKTPGGVATALRLADQCDVLVESMRPGVMDRLGLGYEQVRERNPSVVYCSISAYGQVGPYAQRAGVDGILQADTGLMSIIGVPGAEPCKVQAPIVDVVTGHMACTGILAKLLQRGRDGRGGHLDVNLMNAAISLQVPSFASYLSDKALPARLGSAAPYSAPNEAFEAADGWVMVAAYMGNRWERLCHVLGREELAFDERFATSKSRTTNRAQLRQALNEVFRTRTVAAWIEALLAEDILCAKVATYEDLLAHPQLEANALLATVDVPGFGPLQVPGFPINSREENAAAQAPAPTIGQHTREVLRASGFDGREIEHLLAEGAVS
ncbi:CaiB/BaiF CoA transferase family protein [Ramlibacter albus]|uniref:CoA transferase n=1 Tax=Ramlibacter albus TaxID=2079448 RepID=A0A923MFT6_9BURK|nr:CoA transferase [Ramlibacter albus]MBC5768197.1 CoA transferase [Ramlibacter albus]